jgi:hypothetical protein
MTVSEQTITFTRRELEALATDMDRREHVLYHHDLLSHYESAIEKIEAANKQLCEGMGDGSSHSPRSMNRSKQMRGGGDE